jgi:hypothetical protein
MATTAWIIIGFLYLMVLLKPQKYDNLIPLLAWGTLFEGIVLLIHGLYLNLPLFPFAGDVGFCLIVGGGLLLCNTGTPNEHFSYYHYCCDNCHCHCHRR